MRGAGKRVLVPLGTLSVLLVGSFLYALIVGIKLDYNAIAALAGVVAASTAVVALWSESRLSRFSMGVDLLLRLDERFGADQMRASRRAAVRAIKAGDYRGADDVLDFFEMVGLLVHRGALDRKMVWHNFYDWIHPYYLLTSVYIETERKEDPTIWEDLAMLHHQLVETEKHERNCKDVDIPWPKRALDDFVTNEQNL